MLGVLKRYLIILGLLLALIYPIDRLCHFLTDGFYEHRIVTNLPNRDDWEVNVLPPKEALSQNYHYLGCGGQSFVFESEDHQFVLKFFKHHRWKKDRYLFRLQNMEERVECREQTLMSAVYALQFCQNESRVEYAHLNRGTSDLPVVTFIDRVRRKHRLDLNQYQFIIQRKGITLQERLVSRKARGDLEGAKEDVRSSLELLAYCHHKGIKNKDPYMPRNFGFVDDKPVVIDSGALCPYPENRPQKIPEKDLRKAVARLLQWTDKNYPPLSHEIHEWIKLYLSDTP